VHVLQASNGPTYNETCIPPHNHGDSSYIPWDPFQSIIHIYIDRYIRCHHHIFVATVPVHANVVPSGSKPTVTGIMFTINNKSNIMRDRDDDNSSDLFVFVHGIVNSNSMELFLRLHHRSLLRFICVPSKNALTASYLEGKITLRYRQHSLWHSHKDLHMKRSLVHFAHYNHEFGLAIESANRATQSVGWVWPGETRQRHARAH
jgi:hypothetical protein